MPFLIRHPGAIRPGTVNDAITLNIDFAPMFLDYAGSAAPPEMQGKSFRANIERGTPRGWRKSMYYRYWMHNDASHFVPAHYGIRTERYKLIHYYAKPLGMRGARKDTAVPEWELYDLKTDPREMRNLYADRTYAGVVRTLKKELAALQRSYSDVPCESDSCASPTISAHV